MKILISDPLSEEGLKILEAEEKLKVTVKTKMSPAELKQEIKDYDALIVRSGTKVTSEIIKAARKLKLIGRAGVGLDNVDVEAATRQGIIVMNAPGGNTVSTAEHTITLLLALSRNIAQADASLRSNLWERKKYIGVEVSGKTLGIIGLGRIGTAVGKRAKCLGMKVVAYDPFLSSQRAVELGIESKGLKEVLREADYISLHTPLTAETRHLIGKREFEMMKKGVRVINCARSGIIDEEALLAAIKQGKVRGVALDVFEEEPPVNNPLLKLDCVLATPHLGASTQEAQVEVAKEMARQVVDALLYDNVRNAVNFPSINKEILPFLKPYLELSEKMGRLEMQLVKGKIHEIELRYSGEVTRYELKPISVSFVKGLLSSVLDEPINYVNAPLIARQRGIKLVEIKLSEPEDFTNLISAELTSDKGKSLVAGSLLGKKDIRIVKIDDYYVDVVPQGYILVVSNEDKPGMMGAIGTILGKNKINIASMTLGRRKQGGLALTLLNIDNSIPLKVVNELKKLDNIVDAKMVKL
ncbi:MAG: phosphoglycerate dehydrogenase [Candidatus Omnitrophica bacterium 4484_213]|nr:MAG: phosphoglycerate dehydrogenase [Candidatus Omnitrophica bacterium 4484_213]